MSRGNTTLIIALVLLAVVLSCPLICIILGIVSPRKSESPKTIKTESTAAEEVKERSAVTHVQNYIVPNSQETILEEISAELGAYTFGGCKVEPKGWYAGKWNDKYNVGFEAKVDNESIKWRFFYYPGSGDVEPANTEATKLWH